MNMILSDPDLVKAFGVQSIVVVVVLVVVALVVASVPSVLLCLRDYLPSS